MTKSLVFGGVKILVNNNILALDAKNVNNVWKDTYNNHLHADSRVVELIRKVSKLDAKITLDDTRAVYPYGMTVYTVLEHVDAPDGIYYEDYEDTLYSQGIFEGEDGLTYHQPSAGNMSIEYPEPVLVTEYRRPTKFRVIIFERYFEGDKREAINKYFGTTLEDISGEEFQISLIESQWLDAVNEDLDAIELDYYPEDGSNDHIDFGNTKYNEVRTASETFEEEILDSYRMRIRLA